MTPKAKLDGDPEKRLDGAREGMLAKVREAKLLSEGKLTLAGRPGRELEVAAAGGPRMLFQAS